MNESGPMFLPAQRIQDLDDNRLSGEVVVSAWNRQGTDSRQFEELLSEPEQQRARSFGSMTRRDGYVSGRYLARHALARYWGRAVSTFMSEVEIRPEQNDAGRPMIFLDGHQQKLSLSISHSDHWTVVGLADGEACVGIDAVEIDKSKTFAGLQIWFSAAEQAEIRNSQDAELTSAAFWGFKEAAYKTSPQDVPFVPRDWECLCGPAEPELYYQGTRYSADVSLLRVDRQLLICLVKTQRIAS